MLQCISVQMSFAYLILSEEGSSLVKYSPLRGGVKLSREMLSSCIL